MPSIPGPSETGETGPAGSLSRPRAANPALALVLRNRGVLLGAEGLWGDAAKALRGAARLAPADATILSDLGKALLESGHPAKAIAVLLKARRALPGDLSVRTRLAKALAANHQPLQALTECARCGEYPPALRVQARILGDEGYFHRALDAWRSLFRSTTPDRDDLAMRAACEWLCGNTAAAIELTRQLVDTGPVRPTLVSSLIKARLHMPGETAASIRSAAAEWSRLFPPQPSPVPPPRKSGRRRLRIGYVSHEFQAGPSIHFLLPVLEQRTPERHEVAVYYCGGLNDGWTRRARAKAGLWRESRREEELEAAILADGIDILTDLSGHNGTHLTLFRKRLAPVQVTIPNCPCPSGLPNLDYVFTDRWVCPPGSEGQYSETPVFLPSGFSAYRPPARLRPAPPPYRRNGYITFAMLQRPAKLNAEVWDALAAILRGVPRSRLLVQHSCKGLDDRRSPARKLFGEELESRGVARKRLLLRGNMYLREHLEMMGEIDIALDTFPYNGHVTTCECLWMGVPVISLRRDLHVSRVGWELMDRAGCPELVADTPSAYIAAAVELAKHTARLDTYRGGLRKAMRASRLMDGSVVKDMEDAYEGVWK